MLHINLYNIEMLDPQYTEDFPCVWWYLIERDIYHPKNVASLCHGDFVLYYLAAVETNKCAINSAQWLKWVLKMIWKEILQNIWWEYHWTMPTKFKSVVYAMSFKSPDATMDHIFVGLVSCLCYLLSIEIMPPWRAFWRWNISLMNRARSM